MQHHDYESSGMGALPLNLNLKECVQSIRNAASHAQQGASSRGETEAISSVTNELVHTCDASDSDNSVQAEVLEDDVRASASTTSSEESSQTSPLDQEVRRLKVLKSYLQVLESEHGNTFERLTALASRIFRAPMALVTMADLDKQYCISSRGLLAEPTRKSPFCSHIVLSESDILVVPDASLDKRFANDSEVAGYPHTRFYAGAPLVCPEGYKLGVLSVMDTEPRSSEPSLDEKQSLMELAAMAMEALTDLKMKKCSALSDPAQQIACTAHDLLTPLTGIALSLSLLKEDESLRRKLSEQQKDMIETAANCSAVMNSICQRTMDVFFQNQGRQRSISVSAAATPSQQLKPQKIGPTTVRVSDIVKNLNVVMEPFPKQVPLIIAVGPEVPPEFVSDDMKIFRSATNFLTNACAKTESGSIQLRIFVRKNANQEQELVFECTDTGPGVDPAKYAYLFKPVGEESDPLRVDRSRTMLEGVPAAVGRPAMTNFGLGLYSVATQVSSIGGKYGFRPRDQTDDGSPPRNQHGEKLTGSVFWFCFPLVLPQPPASEMISNRENASRRGDQKRELEHAKAGRGKMSRMLGTKLTPRSPGVGAIYGSEAHESPLPQTYSKLGKKTLSTEDVLAALNSRQKETLKESLESMKDAVRGKRLHPVVSGRRKQHALVIEDSLVVRKTIARALTQLGFEVTQAVNGMEGLKELQAYLFDLVLCDFLMPVMDGLDCIQQYRQWEAVNRPYFRQYIVGISAHASEKDAEQGLKVGMDEFRPKPITYKQLTNLKNGNEFNRVSVELDNLEHEIESLKRRKVDPAPSPHPLEADQKVCLIVAGSSAISKLAELATNNTSWKVVFVTDGVSALGLLKMRNWDAVLVDDELTSSRCMAIFREWEKTHRVNRQNNVILLSGNYIPSGQDGSSSFQVPTAFDDALGKPIQLTALKALLEKAAEKSTFFASDIVTR
jgi:CheY-like chemotaxis protein/GAF domain-containing protein